MPRQVHLERLLNKKVRATNRKSAGRIEEVCARVSEAGCTVEAWMESPIRGSAGNREFLVHATTPEAPE